MAFPAQLTCKLSGVTPAQLRRLRTKEVLIPEIRPFRPPLYSFRDVLALRTIAYLREKVSMQKIVRAFSELDLYNLTDHPSTYEFTTLGSRIVLRTPDGETIDLDESPGQDAFTFDDVLDPFHDFKHRPVAPLAKPAESIAVNHRILGGWPTIERTRVPYDAIANLLQDGSVTPEQVTHFYPSVSAVEAANALKFAREVEAS